VSKKRKPGKRKVSRVWKGIRSSETGYSEKRMTRDHVDLLENVEFALINTDRNNPDIDDRVCMDALRALLHGHEPADDRVEQAVGQLRAIRELRADTPDALWTAALRVVIRSIRRHSTLKPGDRGYLDFVGHFIA
jgi:hypothetical protein